MDLVGRLVRLRAAGEGDAQRLAAALAETEAGVELVLERPSPSARPKDLPVGRGGASYPLDLAELDASLRRRQPELVQWLVEARSDHSVIGYASLERVNLLNRNCWYRLVAGAASRSSLAVASEVTTLVAGFAFRHLGLEKVYASVLEGDERAMQALKSAAFAVEATLDRHELQGGHLVTAYWMAAYRDHPLYSL